MGLNCSEQLKGNVLHEQALGHHQEGAGGTVPVHRCLFQPIRTGTPLFPLVSNLNRGFNITVQLQCGKKLLGKDGALAPQGSPERQHNQQPTL